MKTIDLTQVSKYHINFNNIYFFQSSVKVNQTKYDVKYFCKMTKAPLTYGNNLIMYKYTLYIYSKGNSNTNNTLKNDSLFWGCSVCENVQNSFRNKTRSLRWPSSVSSSISWANRLGKNFSSSWNGNWTNITPNWSVKCCLQSLLIHFKVTTHNTWILFSVRL